ILPADSNSGCNSSRLFSSVSKSPLSMSAPDESLLSRCGRSTERVCSCLSRTMLRFSLPPLRYLRMRRAKSLRSESFSPPTPTMTSPALNPPFSAGLPFSTEEITQLAGEVLCLDAKNRGRIAQHVDIGSGNIKAIAHVRDFRHGRNGRNFNDAVLPEHLVVVCQLNRNIEGSTIAADSQSYLASWGCFPNETPQLLFTGNRRVIERDDYIVLAQPGFTSRCITIDGRDLNSA